MTKLGERGGNLKTGRIIKSISGVYRVESEGALYDTKPRGIFRKKKSSPIVGDMVDFEEENAGEGIIHHIHPRKNALKRPPVSNIDHLVIVMSAVEPEFSTQLLDRFLVIAHSYGLDPVILVTKKDIASEAAITQITDYLNIYEAIGYQTMFVGAHDDIQHVFASFGKGLAVLSGQSGVGKTTLMNHYAPTLNLETNEISKSLNRGRHTTRHVELYETESGYVADTPGFSALDFDHIEAKALKDYFIDLKASSASCKFRDCLHINEPKCNVKAELEAGHIAQFRYDHYVTLLKELQNRKERY